ncbi:MAG TPA: hypothetical protein VGJ08_02580 [Rhizomicrobium sp.]|jgi:hypothetical protein
MANVRIQIDLDENRVRELEQLMVVCGLVTKKELFNNALTLFEWAVDSVRQGRTIASLNEEEQKYRELETPALRTAAAHFRPVGRVTARY